MNTHPNPAPEYALIGKGLTAGKPASSVAPPLGGPKLGKNARKKLVHRSRTQTFLDARLAELNRDGGVREVKSYIVEALDFGDEIHPVDGQPIRFNQHGAIRHLISRRQDKRRADGFALLDLSEQVVQELRPRV